MTTSGLLNALLVELGDTAFSTLTLVVSLGVASLLSLYLYFIYGLASRDVFYSHSFHKLVALIPLITTGIMLAMQSSLIVSIGSLGALSLVRFRNSVRDPMDMLFLLWGVGLGVICGARMYVMALLLCLILTILLFGLELAPGAASAPLLLVVNGRADADSARILELARQMGKGVRVKSRTLTLDSLDLVVELRTGKESELVQAISALEGVQNVSLVSHDGEIRS